MRGPITPKALLNVGRLDNDAVGEYISLELAPYGKWAGPLSAWNGRENLVLRQNVAAPAMQPYSRAIAIFCEAGRFEIDPRHADEHVARMQPHDDGAVEQRKEDALAHPRHKARH